MRRGFVQSILIDLDGTLVDSVPDLADAVNVMMKHLSLPGYSEGQVLQWVGNGTERLVRRALAGAGEPESTDAVYEHAYPVFIEAYQKSVSQRSRLYPGVKAGLTHLKQTRYKLGCVTNKPKHLAETLLEDLGILTYFSTVVGGDSLPQKKPDPAVLRYAASCLDTPIQDCIMIGDSMHDVSAARAAGIAVVCVTYGYNHGEDIRDSIPDAVISNLTEMEGVLASLKKAVNLGNPG